MNITEFLEARITEDEAVARAVIATVAPEEWENPTKWGNFYPEDIAFWDQQTPPRVLAECAAKRAILGLADRDLGSEIERRDASALGAGLMLSDVIRSLAAVYKDHPDYRQEWAL